MPKQLSWLASNANLTKAMQSPSECINTTIRNQKQKDQITLGRLAFQSPALLGGQAARKGLSCESCHRSARGNLYFFIENISDASGTADVSESFFSSSGGDDVFMPVPIPDLADLSHMKISDRTSVAFRDKIIKLVTVEFDGQKPSTKVLDAIQFYLLNIDKKHCIDYKASHQKEWLYDWNRLTDAIDLIEATLTIKDSEHRNFLIRVARLILENLDARFAITENKAIENKLIKSSKYLARISHVNTDIKRKKIIDKWKNKSKKLKALLQKHQKQSAYNIPLLIKYIDNNQLP